MAGEVSPHNSKRQKKLANEEKENVLRDSARANMAPEAHTQRFVSREADEGMKKVDLTSDLVYVSRNNAANGRI